ncbi:MAG: transglutaminase family protein [Desulfuromonadales bacterium]|nr:transglutaminase family protein [Desulfuromonadales bacterium]
MKYRVTHSTEFDYDAPVGLCYNEARLRPRDLSRQQVRSSVLRIDPPPQDIYERVDYFGNRTTYFSIQQLHAKMLVTAVSELQVSEPNPDNHQVRPGWEEVRDALRLANTPELVEASQFTLDSPMVHADHLLAAYAQPSFPGQRSLTDAVHDLMQRIFRDFKYDPEFSSLATPLKDVLEHRSGVCQDFAHLAIGCLRSQGLAARYVSGYLETQPPPGQPRLVGADASHAWFSVFVPGLGWVDYDPTNNQLPGEKYVTAAWGRDYADVTPLKGVAYGGGEHLLKVSVDVEQIG